MKMSQRNFSTAGERVAKSLIVEPTNSQKAAYAKMPSLELEDMEEVQYLQTISEGWAYPLEGFMNE